jgi:hypothetical protein
VGTLRFADPTRCHGDPTALDCFVAALLAMTGENWVTAARS